MKRKYFVSTLFNNCHGLTLEQIRSIENQLPETFPDGLLNDIMHQQGCSESEAIEIALMSSRDVFIHNLHDCRDMLELRDYFTEYCGIGLNDHQVYGLSCMLDGANRVFTEYEQIGGLTHGKL